MCATGITAKAAAPTFTPDGGAVAYATSGSNVTIASGEAESSIIYYSIDGADYESDYTPVSLLVSDGCSISAYAVLCDGDGDPIADSQSSTVTKSFTVQACSFIISHESGSYPEGTVVTITPTPADATITWIYDDGGEGDSGETATITLTTDGTLDVKVSKTGYKPAEDTYTYTVTHACAKPTFDVTVDTETGYATVAKGATVTISSTTTGATIQWRLSETDDWTTGTEVTVTDDCTIYVQVIKEGYTTATGSIVVKVQQLPAPTISPASTTFGEDETVSVTISHDTADATIYYTTDGWTTTQSGASPVTFTVSTTTTVEAYATHASYKDSEHATATYTQKALRKFVYTTNVKPGVEYVIMSSNAGATSFYLMGLKEGSNKHCTALSSGFTLSDDKMYLSVDADTEANIVRFDDNGDETYNMYSISHSNYFNGSTTNATVTFSSTAEKVKITSTTAQSNVENMYWTQINWQGSGHTGYYLQKNDTYPYFGSYNGGQRHVYLYMDASGATEAISPIFSQSNCILVKGTTIKVTCATEGADIVWTFTDKQGKDISSKVTVSYVEDEGWSFDVNQDMIVTAKATKEGLTDSSVVTATYTIVDTDASPRYFKRVKSIDEIKAGVASGEEYIIGAYSRFYMKGDAGVEDYKDAARPALMSLAQQGVSGNDFRLFGAPRTSDDSSVTNFVLIGQEDGIIDDSDDEIQVNNNGVMAMRAKDNVESGYSELAFVKIVAVTDKTNITAADKSDLTDVDLYALKLGDKYIAGITGDNNRLKLVDTPEEAPVKLSFVDYTASAIPEKDEYLVDRILCEWVLTLDAASDKGEGEHTFKCLEYNFGSNINVFSCYQHKNEGIEQVYPFFYYEEDYSVEKAEAPVIEVKYQNATSEAVRNSEGYVGQLHYPNDDNHMIPTVTFDLPSRMKGGSVGKRPKATPTDYTSNDVVICAVAKHSNNEYIEGATTYHKSKPGEALVMPVYSDCDVYAYAMLDGYSTTRSENSPMYYLSVKDTTGIVEVGVDEIEAGAKVFNLQGQLLPRPVKGQVVIVAPNDGRAYKALLK